MSKNVSNNFKNIIKSGGPFYAYATVKLVDGTTFTIDSEIDFFATGNSYSEDAGDGFPLGSALSKQISIHLDNHDERFSGYDFYGAEIVLYTETDIPGGTTERILEGTFTVIDSIAPGDVLDITAYDDMYKLDSDFTSNLVYPATLQQLWNELCDYFDVSNGSPQFKNNDFIVQTKPDGATGREMAGYIAQIAVGNAVADANGRLCIKSYDFSRFDESETATPGEIETDSGIHILSEFMSDPIIGTDDVVITGITTSVTNDEGETSTVIYGDDEYAIFIDNPLITGKEQTAIALIGDELIGLSVRPFSGDFVPNPTVEVMDLVYIVDKKDKVYKSFVTSHGFTYLGFSNVTNNLESPQRNRSTYSNNVSKIYQHVSQQLNNQKTQWETAVEDLQDELKNASGLYPTEEKQPDGSTIYYFHDKPTLEESQVVFKITSQAIAISTDGGETYPTGITVDGEAIISILNTIGINADWINTGALTIEKDGQVMFRADVDTGQVDIVANSFSLRGQTIDEIAQGEVNEFVNGVYAPTLNEIQNQIDQKTETWYQPTDPSLQWTETEESALQDTAGADILDTNGEQIIGVLKIGKTVHEGDLWKNSDTNVEYIYQDGQWIEMPIPDAVFDEIDGKAQIFVVQPTPPYAVGDVWFTGTTILVCDTARESGEFNANDWTKRDNYTDDSALYEFIEGDYASTIDELQTQSDKKAETWYQANDPSTHWNADEKLKHDGDLWYNTSSQKTYIYNGSAWEETKSNPPDEVFDTIDGKAQIFVRQPVPPYSVGDLWFNSATSDIMTCITARPSGSYNASDWQKRNKYTDDSYAEEVAGDLSNFADQVVGDLENMQTQIDGKIETYYYDYQPTLTNIPASAWTTETERQKHIGDLFYYKSTGFTYRFLKDGSTWKWQPIKDEDISKALSDAAEAQDTADSKRRIFTSTPTPPYDVGDLWAQGGSGDIMRCIVARSSGSYVSTDWDKASKYTDDTAVDDLDTALDQEGVFNRLTNNGQAQGIFMRNGQLYINMSFAQSGTLKLGGSNNVNGLLQVYNSSGVLVGTIDNIGAKFTNGSDWLQISQSLLTGGYGSTTDGLLDLSANYSTGRHVVLESKTGDVVLKSADDFRVQRQSGGMGYLVQSGGTDYFDDIGVSFGDTYPIIGIMYGADEQGYNPFLDIRLANGKSVYFSGGTPPSIADSFLVRQVSAAVTQSHGYGERLISLSYSGYKALGVVGYSISSTYHAMYKMNFDSSKQTVTVGIRHVNDTSASGSINVYLQVLYVKS